MPGLTADQSLLAKLCAAPVEAPWLEFKENKVEPYEVGEYISALANAAVLAHRTHAYMVCGVGREPSQWVRAPTPAQGKIGHMKAAVGAFWLPEILGSSPRLEQDNEITKSLHAAMRVSAEPSISPL